MQPPNQPSPGESSSSNGPAGGTMPPFEPLSTEGGPGPAFTVLDPPPARRPSVEPFNAQEIVEGTAIALVVGLRLESEVEAAAFQAAFQWVWRPILPTAKVLDQLGVGEALATYGIGRGMGLGGRLDQLPPFARVACGALVLGVAGYMAYQATRKGVTHEATPMDTASPGPSRDGPGGDDPANPAGAGRDGSVSRREAAGDAAIWSNDHAVPSQ